jgi:hypothetical protein
MKVTIAFIATALLFYWSAAAMPEEPPTKTKATPEFKAPAGFRTKKRGDLVLYCRREAVLGSRFAAEKCYDEAGIREIKRAEVEQKEALERIRACSGSSCSSN